MVGLLLAATPVLAKNNPIGGVVETQKISCAAGGCTLVCKGPNQKAYVREKKIEDMEVFIFGSGFMVYKLDMVGADRQVMIPPSTESCDIRNIR